MAASDGKQLNNPLFGSSGVSQLVGDMVCSVVVKDSVVSIVPVVPSVPDVFVIPVVVLVQSLGPVKHPLQSKST